MYKKLVTMAVKFTISLEEIGELYRQKYPNKCLTWHVAYEEIRVWDSVSCAMGEYKRLWSVTANDIVEHGNLYMIDVVDDPIVFLCPDTVREYLKDVKDILKWIDENTAIALAVEEQKQEISSAISFMQKLDASKDPLRARQLEAACQEMLVSERAPSFLADLKQVEDD